MGKTRKGIPKKDAFQRINYLFQAAHVALRNNNLDLARNYVADLSNIAKKQVLRLDPSIKRAICKKCSMLLVSGITSTVRIQNKRRRQHLVLTCLDCKTVKRIVTPRDTSVEPTGSPPKDE